MAETSGVCITRRRCWRTGYMFVLLLLQPTSATSTMSTSITTSHDTPDSTVTFTGITSTGSNAGSIVTTATDTGSTVTTATDAGSTVTTGTDTGSTVSTDSNTGYIFTTDGNTGSTVTTATDTGSTATPSTESRSTVNIDSSTGSTVTIATDTGSTVSTDSNTGSIVTTDGNTGSTITPASDTRSTVITGSNTVPSVSTDGSKEYTDSTEASAGSTVTTESNTGSTATIEASTGSAVTTDSNTGSTVTTDSNTGSTDTTNSDTGSTETTDSNIGSTVTTDTNTGSTVTTDSNTGSTVTTDSSTGSTLTTDSNTGSTVTTDTNTGSTVTTDSNTGSTVTTDSNTGSTVPTDSNTGSTVTTDSNIGSTVTTDSNTGSTVNTDSNTGSTVTTDSNTGSTVTTDSNTGSTVTTNSNTGSTVTTDSNTGSTVTTDSNTGSTVTTDTNTGSTVTTDSNTGSTVPTDTNTGSTVTTDSNTGSAVTTNSNTVSTVTTDSNTGSTVTSDSNTGSTVTTDSNTGSAVTIYSNAGSTVTTNSNAGSTVTTDSNTGSTVTTDSDTGSTETTDINIGSTVPVDSNTGSTVTTDSDTGSTVPTDINIGSTVPVDSNTGSTVTTDSNTGSTVPTDSNKRSTVTTDTNTGSTVTTDSNTGSAVTTDSNTGSTVPTDSNTGSTVTTDTNTGSTVPTDSNTGSTVTTDANTGSTVTTDSNTGSTVTTDTNTGSTVTTDTNTGSTVTTDTNTGSTVTTDSSTGSTVTTDSSTGSTVTTDSNTGSTVPTDSNTGSTVPTDSNTGSTVTTDTNTGSTVTTDSNTGSTVTTDSNTGSTVPTDSNTGSTVTTDTNTGSTVTTDSNTGSTVTTDTNTGSTVTTDSNTGSTVTTDSNTGSTVTTDSNTGSTVTTDTNTGSTVPTDSNTGSTVTTDTNTGSTVTTDSDTGSTETTDINIGSTVPVDSNTGSTVPTDSNTGSTVTTDSNTGSTVTTDTNTGSTVTTDSNTGSTVPTDTNTGSTVTTDSNTGSTVTTDSNTGSTVTTDTNTGSTVTTDSNTGSTVTTDTNTGSTVTTDSDTGSTETTDINIGFTVPVDSNTGSTVPTDSNTGSTVTTDSNTGSTVTTDRTTESTVTTERNTGSTITTDGNTESIATTESIVTTDADTRSAVTADSSIGSTISTDSNIGSTVSTATDTGSPVSTDSNTGSTFSTDSNTGSAVSTDSNTGSDVSADNNLGSTVSMGPDFTTETNTGQDFTIETSTRPDFTTETTSGSDFTIDNTTVPDITTESVYATQTITAPNVTTKTSTPHDFTAETSTGLDFTTEFSTGRDFTTENSARPTETTTGPDFTTETSTGPDFNTETSTRYDFTAEITTGPDFTAETGRGPNLTTETSRGPDFNTETSTRSDFTTQTTTGSDFTTETSTRSDLNTETSTGPDFTKETSTGPDFNTETSAMPDSTFETSTMPGFTTETSRGPDFTTEASTRPDFTSEMSTRSDFTTETSTGPDFTTQTSTGSYFTTETSKRSEFNTETTTGPDFTTEMSTIRFDFTTKASTGPDVTTETTTGSDFTTETTTGPDFTTEASTIRSDFTETSTRSDRTGKTSTGPDFTTETSTISDVSTETITRSDFTTETSTGLDFTTDISTGTMEVSTTAGGLTTREVLTTRMSTTELPTTDAILTTVLNSSTDAQTTDSAVFTTNGVTTADASTTARDITTENITTPATRVNVSTTPATRVNVSTTPATRVNVSTTPATRVNVSTTPATRVNVSTTTEMSNTTQAEDATEVFTTTQIDTTVGSTATDAISTIVDTTEILTTRQVLTTLESTTTTSVPLCGNQVLTGGSGHFTSPGYPTLISDATSCVWIIKAGNSYSNIRLTFSNITTEERQCRSNHIQVIDGESMSGVVLAEFCGTGNPDPITSSGSSLRVTLVSTADAIGNGFNASWTTVCQKFLTDESGQIQPPGHPNEYPPGVDCTYVIDQIPGKLIDLRFTDFSLDTATSGECSDFVEIRDGGSDLSPLLLDRLCGTSLPANVTSSRNMLWVRFYSDDVTVNGSSGFSLSYSARSPGCSSPSLTGNDGSFTSPGYPQPYPGYTTCQWTITVEPGLRIELTFDTMAIYGWGRYCYGHYVKIYDSNTTDASTLIDTYCGSSIVPPVRSTSNTLTVVFTSDRYSTWWFEYYNFNGFSASYVTFDPLDPSVVQYDLFPFGADEADIVVDFTGDNDAKHVYLDTGLPFRNQLEHDVYIGSNGLVSFGSRYIYPYLSWSNKVVCVYASYIDVTNSHGGVYYQVYNGEGDRDEEVLTKATDEVREFTESDTFQASLVLVVTWDRVQQRDYYYYYYRYNSQQALSGEATFQAAFISDGSSSHVLVYHKHGAMGWRNTRRWPYVIMGVSLGAGNQENVKQSVYSYTEEAYSIDKVKGNTGHVGMWLYTLGERIQNPQQACNAWYNKNRKLAAERSAGFQRLPQCPCSLRDAWRRARFTWSWSRYDNENRFSCYRLSRSASRRVAPFGKECCYSWDWSNQQTYMKLIVDPPFAGGAQAYNPVSYSNRDLHQQEDRTPHDWCCHQAASHRFCRKYYELRPIGECRANIPFTFSWMFGDPHIETLDGRQYTFNGLGEYTLVTFTNFTLQGRTALAKTDSGTPTNATVFTAFGAEENNIRVFVGLDPSTNNTMEIYANGTDYSLRFRQEEDLEVDTDDFTLVRDNNSLVVAFPSQISLRVSVGFKSLDISVTIPEEFKGQTTGLLGNFNGNDEDDFRLPDGTVLANNLTERQLYEQFGRKWAVTDTTSVMRYEKRTGPADYANPDFIPLFLDEQPADVRQAAENQCGGSANLACIYDYVATGSQAFATASKQTADTANKTQAESKNSLPEVTVQNNVSVTSGVTKVISITGIDADSDPLTYRLVDDAEGALQIDASTGDITVALTTTHKTGIRVYAEDSQGAQSPVVVIAVQMCSGCNGRGQCDFGRGQVSIDDPNFQTAPCVCHPAYTGQDCQDELYACLNNPCLQDQVCVDLSPAEQGDSEVGYNCTGCPDGYTYDSGVCVDVDECNDTELNTCDTLCTNTGGSFTCSCNQGYRLLSDGRTCFDVDECAYRTHNCQQICENTAGGFNCSCQDGYTLDPVSGTQCEQTDNATAVCDGFNCTQGCQTAVDVSSSQTVAQCFCFAGYKLNTTDNKTCDDQDECADRVCSQTCLNTPGSFACSCYSGFKLADDQRTCVTCSGLSYGPECRLTCDCNGRAAECNHVTGCVCQVGWKGSGCQIDVNECEETPGICGESQVCVNSNGSYTCRCVDGYTKNNDGKCEDVDECGEGSVLNTCGELEKCNNVPGSFYCTCNSGYKRSDSNTCIDIDECTDDVSVCQQTCQNVPGTYNCDCNYGYRLNQDRVTCTQVQDVCAELENLNCDHGCTLDDDTDQGVCFCNTGYTLQDDGQTCQDVDECTLHTDGCSDNCTNTAGGFQCSCPVGKVLDNDKKTCIDCPRGTYGPDCRYTCGCGIGAERCDVITGCVCLEGWTGAKCNHDVIDCDIESVRQQCRDKNAECRDVPGSYTCQCPVGYAEDETGVCQDVDECVGTQSPCSQTCENTAGSYRCLCNQGFQLDDGSTDTCVDVDECHLSVTNPCTQRCDNTPGSYICSCNVTGYTLHQDRATCVPKTICSRTDCDSENGGCAIDGDSSVESCFCNAGYRLDSDNTTCSYIDVDWCAVAGCQHVCTEIDDGKSYMCSCNDGYLINTDQQTCRACTEGTYGPGCSQTCACNTQNTLSCNVTTGICTCKPGWQGVTCSDDVDECDVSFTGPACPANSNCSNINGSFLCTCHHGFFKSSDGNCSDVNECEENTHDCSQVCNNIPGSYNCSCRHGFSLSDDDHKTCTDIDECTVGTDDCSQNCQNTVGSFTCTCRGGFSLAADGRSCDDINECEGQHGCSHECDNQAGSYTCRCRNGYTLNTDGRHCDDIDECVEGTAACSQNCSNMAGSYTCSCLPGYNITTTNSSLCQECSDFTYGVECRERCQCLPDNTRSCDHVVGTCICKRGLKGGVCEEVEQNATCAAGQALDLDLKCVAIFNVKFQVVVAVELDFDPTATTSDKYRSISRQARVSLLQRFLRKTTGILDILVTAIRKGSLIVDSEAVIAKETRDKAGDWLTSELQALQGDNLTIGNLTGNTDVIVDGSPVTGRSKCDVYLSLGVCDVDHDCQVQDGQARCRFIGTDDEDWKLIVGLSVSIPLAFILLGVAFCCCYCWAGGAKASVKPAVIVREPVKGDDQYTRNVGVVGPYPWRSSLGKKWSHSYAANTTSPQSETDDSMMRYHEFYDQLNLETEAFAIPRPKFRL